MDLYLKERMPRNSSVFAKNRDLFVDMQKSSNKAFRSEIRLLEKLRKSPESNCMGCGAMTKDNKMKECPCKTVQYCSKQCRDDHWPKHKLSCPCYKKK